MNELYQQLTTTLSPSLLWFFIGFLFLVGELLNPSAIVFFFGFGAWSVALIVAFMDLTLATQMTLFLVSSLLYLALLRKTVLTYIESKTGADPYPIEDEFLGKVVVVTEAIRPPLQGKVLLNGTHWNASSSMSIEEGTSVRVEARESLTLTVTPLSNNT
jgi:membrane protein implicated in regulation of membrane protease activity